MIEMTFRSFLTLAILGLASTFVLHSLFRYRMLPGIDGFLGKWATAWIGGWLGSAVFGHWSMQQVPGLYLIPAILGALVAPFLATAMLKAFRLAITAQQASPALEVGGSTPAEMRKAS